MNEFCGFRAKTYVYLMDEIVKRKKSKKQRSA